MTKQCEIHEKELKIVRERSHSNTNEITKLVLRLDDVDKKTTAIDTSIRTIFRTMVTWKHFIYIVGVIFMFMSIVLGSIWVQVNKNGDLTNTNNSAISRIEGILTTALDND